MRNNCTETVSVFPYLESTLPIIQNSAYDEEVSKFEDKINKQFSTEEREMNRIHEIDVKIEGLAFDVFKEEL